MGSSTCQVYGVEGRRRGEGASWREEGGGSKRKSGGGDVWVIRVPALKQGLIDFLYISSP